MNKTEQPSKRFLNMPSHGKEEAITDLSNAYKDNDQKLKQIEEQRDVLLGGKSFAQLSYAKQLQFCRLNKKLMENYWTCYELACEDKNYGIAALNIAKALTMGFPLAHRLFSIIITSNELLEEELQFFPNSDENIHMGIRYYLGLGVSQSREKAKRWFSFRGGTWRYYCAVPSGLCQLQV